MATTELDILYKNLSDLTNKFPANWTPVGSTCYLFSFPGGIGINICNFFDDKNDMNIGVTTMDNRGRTISDININSKIAPEVYKNFLEIYNTIGVIAKDNKVKKANEAIFKGMSTHYTVDPFGRNKG